MRQVVNLLIFFCLSSVALAKSVMIDKIDRFIRYD